MPQENETHSLRLFASRGGSVAEITSFLQDLESSYNKLYLFYTAMDYFDPDNPPFRRWSIFWYEFGLPVFPFSVSEMPSESILPEDRLIIRQIQVASSGFWEFVGSLNPLQQIREYLNDRHKRRQDREYREKSEAEKLTLENELIEKQILEKENSVLRERIAIMKDLGLSNKEIRRLIWGNAGKPLTALAKHQDTGLIENAE